MKGATILRGSGVLGKEKAGKENEWERKEYLILSDPILEFFVGWVSVYECNMHYLNPVRLTLLPPPF